MVLLFSLNYTLKVMSEGTWEQYGVLMPKAIQFSWQERIHTFCIKIHEIYFKEFLRCSLKDYSLKLSFLFVFFLKYVY